ncbi:MAG: DUF58 domain-containing protein [Clostridia bacterium]|nr:DUF58 domain-containing protein [Clostridia bacterium]
MPYRQKKGRAGEFLPEDLRAQKPAKPPKKEKKKDKAACPASERYGRVSAGPGLKYWFALWLFALLFTQLLRAPASNIFFGFITFLPPVSILYTLIARSALKVYMVSNTVTAEKNRPVDYEFRIINESVFPYPFIDAFLRLPELNSVKTAERCVKISAAPLSHYDIKSTVRFRFRGTYEIGVVCIYVYDFLRLIRVKTDLEGYTTAYVLPRRLVIDEDSSVTSSDSARRTKKSPNSYEKIEVSDIRDYRLGDPLKSIHWKLSSKAEELVVKDYNSGTTDITYVIPDLSRRFPENAPDFPFVSPFDADAALPVDVAELISDSAYEDMSEYCADGVVELAVASVLKELRAGRTVELMWYDARSEIGAFAFELRSSADFDIVFELFATAPLASADKTVAGLTRMIGDAEDAKFIFVLPTLDDDTVTSLCTMATVQDSASGGSEVVVYSAEERFAHPKERSAYLETCRTQLAERGLTLVKGTLEGFFEMPDKDRNTKGE